MRLLFIFLFLPLSLLAEEQPWQVFKSTHFLVFYKGAKEPQLNELTERAEEYYNKITDDLGFARFNFWTWDDRAKIYLSDSQEEYRQLTGDPDWSAGHAQAGSKLIYTFITAPGFLDNVLAHEMAHIIFREMVGFNNPAVPLWLDEGVASFQEKKFSFVKADLADRIRQGDFLSLEDLGKVDVANLTETGRAELFYAESFSLVRYLIDTFGKDRFVLFCQNLRDYKDLRRALALTYSFGSLAEFESSWKKYILQ
ncbi:MAG: peptidase MA family metallohydrolase [Candidatus Omnitrophica bacterium]|nr:peptidase MA family metallohydrolase [Candidatus Omnitrophota bacterium]